MAEPTTYIVLRQDLTKPSDTSTDVTASWRVENGNVLAASADAAIRLACKTDEKPYGTYVAVPARSWKPVKVSAVQSVVLKLEEAT